MSMLFRAIFPGSPHLHPVTRIFVDQNEPTSDFSPPWTPFRWPAWRTPRILPSTNGLPTAILPVPHPTSLIAVIHYLYFGDLEVLRRYIRENVPPGSSPEQLSTSHTGIHSGLGNSTSHLCRRQYDPCDDNSNISSLQFSGRFSSCTCAPQHRHRPTPLQLNNIALRIPVYCPIHAGTPLAALSPCPSDIESFTVRWQGVINNAEYLGLPVSLRTWLSSLWKKEYPDVEMPTFKEELYIILTPSPSPSPSPESTDSEYESEDDEASVYEDNTTENGGREPERIYGRPLKSPSLSKDFEHFKPYDIQKRGRNSRSPTGHDWRAEV